VPFYNFKTGRREGPGTRFTLGEKQIILLDSLHGLYDEMTAAVPTESKFKLYIETLSQLKRHAGPLRALERTRACCVGMSRDRLFRAYAPARPSATGTTCASQSCATSFHFCLPSITSSMARSVRAPVLKGILWKMFPEMIDAFANDPKRQDAFIRGKRVQELLARIDEVVDTSAIPADSLLREFIGGSSVVGH